ncbi:MAG TPA: glycosyltransferase 87 family protein [Verrucomicrobiae bacterium]
MQPGDADQTVVRPKWVGWLLHPGIWFWLVIVLGTAIRLYFVIFTQGTNDVELWQQHATGVRDLGLTGYYHSNALMNHPPLIGVAESLLLRAADATGIPFRILLRAPFALIDAGTTLLLLGLLRRSPWRFAAAACYWLNPLAMIFSAYHGNTDSAVAFSLMLCVWLLSKGNVLGAGAAMGAGLSIKLPGVLVFPALFFFVQGWRRRLIFLFATGITVAFTYLPAICRDAGIVYKNVFGYRGEIVQTVNGMPVWGPRALMFSFLPPSDKWPASCVSVATFFIQNDWLIAVLLMLLLAWLRRSRRTAPEVCATIAMSYAILYGMTDNWSFQYFAWSVPFWFFLRPWFWISATALAGGYIYSLYWFLCGNPWLLGNWDFVGKPQWPLIVIMFRNLAVLFFLSCGCMFLILALKQQIIAWLKTSNARSSADPVSKSKKVEK